jgi:hypothetical protein
MTNTSFSDDDNLNDDDELFTEFEAAAETSSGDTSAEPAAEMAEAPEGGVTKAPPRTFTAKARKSGKLYTFKRVKSARSGQKFFDGPRGGTLEERSRLFDETAYRMEELREKLQECANHGVHLTAGTVEAIIPISWLSLDEKGCRGIKINWNHVAEIITTFSEKSLDLPKVTMRKVFDPATGQLSGVVIALTDGVHRTVSLFELGDTHVRVMVTLVDDVADEAQIYSDCNYNRRAHGRHHRVSSPRRRFRRHLA